MLRSSHSESILFKLDEKLFSTSWILDSSIDATWQTMLAKLPVGFLGWVSTRYQTRELRRPYIA